MRFIYNKQAENIYCMMGLGVWDGLQTKYADGKSFKTKFDIHVYVFEFLMPCIINIWSSFYKTFSYMYRE